MVSGAAARESVDMVVVGDMECGKTSLITTLVSSIFPESVPKVLQQVRVPPEETADRIALSIADTSSAPEDLQQTLKQVAQADVVVLLYSAAEETTFRRVQDFWLPEILKIFRGPIIVVGNKNDLVPKPDDRAESLRAKVEPLLKVRQIDACMECSAKLNINVSDVFNLAQQSVVYPISPLFDTQMHELTDKFKGALKRVFRIFDRDRDDLLSDQELINFQESCFGARLQPTDIEDVKSMLEAEGPRRVTTGGITFDGFLSIHKRFIQRNRAETSWLVLRQFGFNDSLELQVPREVLTLEHEDLSRAGSSYPVTVRERSVELSRQAQTFLADVFNQFDKDKDQALTRADLEEIFSVCPAGMQPWTAMKEVLSGERKARSESGTNTSSTKTLLSVGEALRSGPLPAALCCIDDFPRGTRTDAKGNLTLGGWLAEWHMVTLLQPHLTLIFLYFLGFDRRKEQALWLTRKRSIEDSENRLQRNVVRAFVFGAHEVGKSKLLDALPNSANVYSGAGVGGSENFPHGRGESQSSFAAFTHDGNPIEEEPRRKRNCRNAVGRVRVRGLSDASARGSDTAAGMMTEFPQQSSAKHLVLTEIAPENDALEEAFSSKMADCDLGILMFDSTNPSSVDWLAGIQKRIPDTVPCVYLASKIDIAEAESLLGRAKDKDGTVEPEKHRYLSQAVEEAAMLCAANSLPDPEPVSLILPKNRMKLTRLFELLMTVAMKPDTARPISEEKKARRRQQRLIRASLRISLVATVLVVTGLMAYSMLGRNRNNDKNTTPKERPSLRHANAGDSSF